MSYAAPLPRHTAGRVCWTCAAAIVFVVFTAFGVMADWNNADDFTTSGYCPNGKKVANVANCGCNNVSANTPVAERNCGKASPSGKKKRQGALGPAPELSSAAAHRRFA